MDLKTNETIPAWLPEPMQDYLAHTVDGRSIRALARERRVHPSTILRQVRSCEARREDPLIDAALKSLSEAEAGGDCAESRPARPSVADATDLDTQTENVLRRLCEPGAVMAVARAMDSAVVVREDASGETVRTAVVDGKVAQVLALRNWIHCPEPATRIARYFITPGGRTEMRRLMARSENRAQGFSDRQGGWTTRDEADALRAASRVIAVETPLMSLARRRDKTGKPFLGREHVRAGERLREDFVLADPGPQVAEDWRAALAVDEGTQPPAVLAARARVIAAMKDLGPGLEDAVLRCCCLLEGLEVTEAAMGWSARSGKVVLGIALERLRRHYAGQAQPAMIG
ncbi:helix-turn-helix domain-containing protein [Salipiger sp. IMCC34102]|uniref:DUF6456 domain-containing protein n=1 Tax=Salipiger sp. IMCC34102 TaxID=2510647 RepID=UPI00101D2FFA|nr:DUF6456 domain-containing protein [Salipiger sp. IMCC34102]RYH03409.1 helix-turn-helix domain-containing protein [Salipiger sp. IMCC34102]